MNRRFLLPLIATTLLSSPAWALEPLKCSPRDRHVCSVAYRADDVVEIDAEVGATVAVQLSDKETLGAGSVAVSDRSDLKVSPDGSVLFLKAMRPMALQPIFLKTVLQDGTTRVYPFEFQATDDSVHAVPKGAPVAGVSTVADTSSSPLPAAKPLAKPFLIRFTYPGDIAAARRVVARKAAAEHEASRAIDALAAAPPAPANYRYVAQGDTNLVPDRTWDDGQSTFLHFPGSVRIPAVYVIAPDGKEAITDYSVKDGLITISQSARMFRLRDGDTVLNLWNQGWNPVGTNPGTGTTSPNVIRTVKVAAQ